MYAPAPGATRGSVSLTVVRSSDQTARGIERTHYVVYSAREPGRSCGTDSPTTSRGIPAQAFCTLSTTGAAYSWENLESWWAGGRSSTHVELARWIDHLEYLTAWSGCLATTTTFPGNGEPLHNSSHKLYSERYYSAES